MHYKLNNTIMHARLSDKFKVVLNFSVQIHARLLDLQRRYNYNEEDIITQTSAYANKAYR